jgi:PRTRC genetic system ThiF family protein
MKKPNVHFIHKSLLSPVNPITVNVIGAGGTGSHLVEALARIHFILTATAKAGLHVQLFDHDVIESPNLGRAAFNENYLGMNKAVAVINHINRKYGTNWKGIPVNYVPKNMKSIPKDRLANLTFSCVDSVQARLDIAEVLRLIGGSRDIDRHRDRPLYLMDMGNDRKTGQVMLSTLTQIVQPESELFEPVEALPLLTDEFAELLSGADRQDYSPSCSILDALNKQSLFINSTLANLAGALLDEMLSDGVITVRGFFVNLETFTVNPMKIDRGPA